MEEESNHKSLFDDLYESCLGNPFPEEVDLGFNQDRLFQIENEFARSIQQDHILETHSSFLVEQCQEESTVSGAMPGEETSSIDLLLMGAEAVDARNWDVAFRIIAMLDVRFPRKENGVAPFDRLAFYFTRALDLRCSDNIRGMTNVAAAGGGQNTTSTVCAVQMVQELSPYIKFAHFTANQAILEATLSDRDIHVVGFDIMEGIQWPPLMADLASRHGGCSLLITAVIADNQNPRHANYTASRTGRRLKEFAASIHLEFEFDQVVMTEENFRKLHKGRTVVANCMSHQLHMPNRSRDTVGTFLRGVTTLVSPKLVVLVQDELHNMNKSKSPANASFVDFFCEALHHYTEVSESLASGFGVGYETRSKQLEKEILRRRIVDCLRGFPEGTKYRPGLVGYKPSPISEKNIAQSKFLVGLFCRDYWVQHEKEGVCCPSAGGPAHWLLHQYGPLLRSSLILFEKIYAHIITEKYMFVSRIIGHIFLYHELLMLYNFSRTFDFISIISSVRNHYAIHQLNHTPSTLILVFSLQWTFVFLQQ